MGRELRAQLAFQEARKTRKGAPEDDASLRYGGSDDLRLGPAECRRDVAEIRWHGSDATFPQFRGGLEERPLSLDFLLHERGDHSEILNSLDLNASAALDGDVEVFPNRPNPAHDFARRTEQGAECQGDLARFVRGRDIWGGRDFHERDAQSVEPIHDLAFRLAKLPRGVFFQEDGRYANPFSVDCQLAVEGYERGPLEARRVRSVDHDLPHEVDLVHGLRVQQEGDLQRNVQGLRVRQMGRPSGPPTEQG